MSGPSSESDGTFVVRYRYDEGVLLDGNTRPHKKAIKKAWPRWRWFPSIQQWGIPRSRNTARTKGNVELYANGLTQAGVPNVTVDYEAPTPENLRDFGEFMAEREKRSIERAARLDAKAERLDDEASDQFEASRGATVGIPPGQPILVGHHSERRHRRDLARSDRAMGKSVQASRDAKHARNRAAGARGRVAATQTPSFAIRRIREATQRLRELEVEFTGKAPASWRGFIPRGPASGPRKEELLLAQAEQQSKLRHYRDGLSQTHVPLTTEMRDRGWVRKGDWLMSDRGKIPLIQVANKTAVVGYPKSRQRMNLDRLWVARAILEKRGFTDPAAAATSPEAETAPTPPAPPKPTTPPTPATPSKPTAKEPEYIELFARSFQIEPDEQLQRTGSVKKALAEAERQGFADQMFGWLRARNIEGPGLLATAYGRARGTVALEQDRWPPPPIQGTTYGHEYFLGVIGSLQTHPVVAELSELTRFWGERMEQIGGGPRNAPYGRDHARRGLHVVTDELERQRLLLESGSTPTPALAKSTGDTVIAEASRVLAHLKVLHDPALYDGSIPVEEVLRRLCDIDPQVATEVLQNSHGVEFSNKEPLDKQARKLCDGDITLDDLRQTVAREAEQRQASDAMRQQQRLQDAAELLKVRDKALSRHRMTVSGINVAYHHLWPKATEEQRKRRRLKITPGRSGRAIVLGPSGHSFVGPDLDTNDRERIEGLFRAIEQELHEAQGQPTTPGSAQPELPKHERPQPPSKPSKPRQVASSQAATIPPKTTTTAKTTGPTAPTKPKDIEAFARSFQLQPNERWPPDGSVEKALAEAERQGFADPVFRWLRAHNVQRPDLLADAYGKARGIVALEQGSWPPPPIRGSTYGRDHYSGILNSLRTHPVVVELAETARFWGDRMEKIGGGPRSFPYGRDQARRGGAVVSDVLASQRLELQRGTKPTHALAKSAGDTVVAEASRILAQLKVLLDPALYDGSIPVEEVRRRLCDIDPQVAKEVLRSSHGVEFSNDEPLDVQAHKLCDGDITLDDLRTKVAQEAEERRASKTKQQQQRLQDAAELLKVRAKALSRGPMTVRRFNIAYRQMWPNLTDRQRRLNRLGISGDRPPRAFVRGPSGHGFSGPRLGTNDQERIDGLFRAIEQELNEAKGESTTPSSTKPTSSPSNEKRPPKHNPADSKPSQSNEEPPSKPEDLQAFAYSFGLDKRPPPFRAAEKALAEAERRGFGPRLLRWLRAHTIIQPLRLSYTYGVARGIVALEQERWPPPPLKGTVYGAQHYLGVVRSLEHHPTIAELLTLTRSWRQRMRQIGGPSPDFVHIYRSVETARRLFRRAVEFQKGMLDRGATPTHALAKEAGKNVIRSATGRLADLKVLLDPALYDSSLSAEELLHRLCPVGVQIAQEILRSTHNLEFPLGDSIEQQMDALCDGTLSLKELGEAMAQQSAAYPAPRPKRPRDAEALLEIRTKALSGGPLTIERFNDAYSSRWPTTEELHRDRQLAISSDQPSRAFVLGPFGRRFFGPRLDTDDEDRIAALFEVIEQALNEAQGRSATPSQSKPRSSSKRSKPSARPAKPQAATSPASSAPPKSAATKTPIRPPLPAQAEDLEGFAHDFSIAPNGPPPPDTKITNAITAAERKGFAGPLIRWLQAHEIVGSDALARAYGEARGAIAFEEEQWPPPPLQGTSYDAPHYLGLIGSLKNEPTIARLLQLSRTWPQRLKKSAGDDIGIIYGLRRARDVGELVNYELDTQQRKLERGVKPTQGLARSVRDTTVAEASRILTRLEVLLDPALYNGSLPIEEVKRRLCKVQPEIAQQVLMYEYGVDFSFETPLDRQAHDLCDGKTSLDGLRETVDREIRETHPRDAEQYRKQLKDAEALLMARDKARSKGALTVESFNAAYFSLWPPLAPDFRKARRLKMTKDQPPRAFVQGRLGTPFFGPQVDSTDEDRIIALFKNIEIEARTLRRYPTLAGQDKPKPARADTSSKPASPSTPANAAQYPAGPIANEARPSADDDPAVWTAKRATEARHLLRVRDDARGRGPLTARRFNIAYNRAFPKAGSDERRLVLSVDAPPRQAFVRGPNHAQFNGPEVDGSFQDAIDRLMKVLERAAAAAPSTPAPPAATSSSNTPTDDEPRARLEHVDVATGAPAAPNTPGTLSTGRVVADIDGETVEIDPEDLVGRGDSDDPRTRTYRFDSESPLDYPGQARAQKQARARQKKPKRRRVFTPRKTFDSSKGAAKLFYDNNASFFDHVLDPWDGLRDWMDGIEVRAGKGHKKLAQTPAGKRIVNERHTAKAIRHALAYVFGQAKGRRWEAVSWDQIDRLESSLAPYFEAPTEGGQPGLTWRPFTGTLRVEDLDAMSPEQREAARVQESVREIGEQLQQLRSQYKKIKECLPTELREVVERRISEWSRWLDDPSQIPDYACEPDPKSMGYLCNYPAIAGELAQLRRSCADAYDPEWAARDSKAATPGFPDTSGGEDEAGEANKTSVAECCGTPATPNDAKTNKSRATTRKKKAPKRKTKQSKTKPSTAKAPRASKAQRSKDAKQRREWTAAKRRAYKLQCSADAAKTQAKTIDLGTYEKRVKATAADEKAANKAVAAANRAHAAAKRSHAKLRSSKAPSKELRAARAEVAKARCAARVAKSTLTQRTRDHRRAQTELRNAKARVAKRQAVADKRQRNAKRADKHAKALEPKS